MPCLPTGIEGNVISVLKENISHTVVSRLLISDAMLGGQQQAADDFHGILCAGRHDDLIRRADDAPDFGAESGTAERSSDFLVGFIANGLAVSSLSKAALTQRRHVFHGKSWENAASCLKS